jgi:hypothetical protein
MNPGWRLVAIMLPLVVASGFVDFRIRQFPEHSYTVYIPSVVDGTAEAPGRYRVLVPFANTWLANVTGAGPALVWHVTRLAWFFGAYLSVYAYLRTWVSVEASLAGAAGVAATLPLLYTNSWAHPDSIPELALFTLGCLAVVRKHDGWFAVLLALATLNRETAAFLVVVYFLARPITPAHITRTLVFSALCIGILGGIRLWRGFEHYQYWQLGRNLTFLGLLPSGYDLYKRFYAWFIVVLATPAIALIVSGWARVPADARRLVWSAGPLAVTGFLISSIIEPRIFLPFYPMLLPALMCVLVQPKRSDEEYSFDH